VKKNHTNRTGPQRMDVPAFIARVNSVVVPRLEALCADLTKNGRRIGDEFVAPNPTRVDRTPGSFKINIKSGRWADFATGDCGGDAVSLYAYIKNIKQMEAAKELAAKYGVTL